MFSIPKLIFPFEPKKKTAGIAKFLSEIARTRNSKIVGLSELEKSVNPVSKLISITIKVPTTEDYKKIPNHYVVERPLLKWQTLLKIPSGIKRLHDWYMRASSAGIDTLNIYIPEKVFLSQIDKCIITFEDVWLMMNLKRLDVQIVTAFTL